MADARTRSSRTSERQIKQYDHAEAKRKNNPPVGLVTPQTDRDAGKKRYAYDPHIDPALQFDPQSAEVEEIIDAGLAAAMRQNGRQH